MIDTQQQYIKLNIRGEISIIVVQAHSASGRKRDIYNQQRASRDDAKRNIFFLVLNAGHPVCRSPIPFNQIVVDKRY
jgi:hypothetical protein